MRGIVMSMLALFWIICLLLIYVTANFGLRVGGGKEYELPVKVDVYSMENALDASETYMKTGLRYSVYQACYDVLGGGGWNSVPEDSNINVGGMSATT
jgi:hypothetical protein